MNKQKKIFPLIGTHMSIAGGLHKALLDGQSIGCTAIQIFVKNSRQWLSTTLTSEAITLFKEKKEETGIMVIAHAGYLINVASHSPEIEKKSIESLTQELERCDKLGIEYLVLHPGSYTNDLKEDSLYRISKNINQIYTTKNYNCSILLETMAGQGSSIGSSFEELAHIIQHLIIPNKIGICLDTCHLFAAGYIFNTQNEYNNLINSLDHIIGLKFVKELGRKRPSFKII